MAERAPPNNGSRGELRESGSCGALSAFLGPPSTSGGSAVNIHQGSRNLTSSPGGIFMNLCSILVLLCSLGLPSIDDSKSKEEPSSTTLPFSPSVGFEPHSWDLEFSSDGQWIVQGGRAPATSSQCSIWAVGGEKIWSCPSRGSEGVNQVSLHPDKKMIAISFKYSGVTLWNVPENFELGLPKSFNPERYRSALFSECGSWLALQRFDPNEMGVTLEVWSYPDLKQLATLFIDSPGARRMHHFAQDGSELIFANRSGISRWRWREESSPQTIFSLRNRPNCLAIHAESNRVAWEFGGSGIAIADLKTGKVIQRVKLPGTQVRALEFSPDGNVLASAGGSRSYGQQVPAILWDCSTGEILQKLPRGISTAFCVAFSPDGSRIAVGGEGKEGTDRITTWSRPKAEK